MRQQRTQQVRRRFDISEEPQYAVLQWVVQLEGGHFIRLQVDDGLNGLALKGMVPLWCESLAAFPIGQVIIGDDIQLEYAGFPQVDDTFSILGQTNAVRTYQGGRLAQKSEPNSTPQIPFSWAPIDGDGSTQCTIQATSGQAPYTLVSDPAMVNETLSEGAIDVVASGDDIEVSFTTGLTSGMLIACTANPGGWKDANGQPMQLASVPIP